jgi:HEAT repeat protein
LFTGVIVAFILFGSALAYGQDEVARLVEQLGDGEYAKRNEAFDSLHKMGYKILNELQKHKEKATDAQIRYLLDKLLILLNAEKREAELTDRVVSAGFSKEDAEKVVDLLVSDRPQFRIQGLMTVMEKGGNKGVEILIEYLFDENIMVSVVAADMLAKCGTKGERRILESLIKAMERAESYTATFEMYLSSFFNLYDPMDGVINRRLMEMPDKWRSQIVAELVVRSEPKSVFAYAYFLGDKDETVRRNAIGGIGLVTKELRGENFFLSISKDDADSLLDALKSVFEKNEEDEIVAATKIIAHLKLDAAYEMLVDIVKNRSTAAAEVAINGLAAWKKKEAVEVIINAMKKNELLIPVACKALIEFKDSSIVGTLKELAMKPGAVFSVELLDCIAALSPEEMLDVGLHIISEGQLPAKRDAQVSLFKSLRKTGLSEAIVDKLIGVVKSGDLAARLLVADLLAQLGDKGVADKLRELMNGADAGTKAAVVKAIALIEKDSAIARDYLMDDSFGVRWRAAEALALLGDIHPLLRLKKITFDLSDGTVSEHMKDLFRLYGINLFIDPFVRAGRKLTLKEGMSLLEAVQYLAVENGLVFDGSFGVVLFAPSNRLPLYRDFKLEKDGSVALESPLVSLVIRGDRIKDILERIGEYVGFEVKISDDAKEVCTEDSDIECALVGVRAFDALRLILAPYALKARLEKSVLYVTK